MALTSKTSKATETAAIDLMAEWLITNALAIIALLAGWHGFWALSIWGLLIAGTLALVLLSVERDAAKRRASGNGPSP